MTATAIAASIIHKVFRIFTLSRGVLIEDGPKHGDFVCGAWWPTSPCLSTTKARTTSTVLFTGEDASVSVFIHAVAVSPFFLSGTLTYVRISLVNAEIVHVDSSFRLRDASKTRSGLIRSSSGAAGADCWWEEDLSTVTPGESELICNPLHTIAIALPTFNKLPTYLSLVSAFDPLRY